MEVPLPARECRPQTEPGSTPSKSNAITRANRPLDEENGNCHLFPSTLKLAGKHGTQRGGDYGLLPFPAAAECPRSCTRRTRKALVDVERPRACVEQQSLIGLFPSPLSPAGWEHPQGLGSALGTPERPNGSCGFWAPRASTLAPPWHQQQKLVCPGTRGPGQDRKLYVRTTPVRHRAPLPRSTETECGVVGERTRARCCSHRNPASGGRWCNNLYSKVGRWYLAYISWQRRIPKRPTRVSMSSSLVSLDALCCSSCLSFSQTV